MCEIYSTTIIARLGLIVLISIYIVGLNISADGAEFSYLKEETVSCKVTYLGATDTLVEIQVKPSTFA